MPKLIIMGGIEIPLTDAEAAVVGKAWANGDEIIGVKGNLINAKGIAGIFTDEVTAKKLTAGRLHDGTQVRIAFGRWVDANNPDVHISPAHYTEITKDMVMDDETWEREIKPIETTAERRSRFMELMTPKNDHALSQGTTEKDHGGGDRGVPALPGGDA